MAGGRCTTFSMLALPTTTTAATVKFNPVIFASISSQSTFKLSKRKNYLRPKILKTLIKPYPSKSPIVPQEPSIDPVIPIIFTEPPATTDLVAEAPADDEKVEEYCVSEGLSVVPGYNGSVSKFSGVSVLKVGVYLVGIFVFQTVCAVWVLGNGKSKKENADLRSSDSGINPMSQRKVLLDGYGKFMSKEGNVILFDESLLEMKIEEIRAMAREARRREEKDVKQGIDDDSDDESAISRERNVIEKEIGARLVKLQKKLNSARGKAIGLHTNFLEKSEKLEEGLSKESLDAKELDEPLMFKKKLKFRSPLTEQRSDPKGFQSKRKKSGSARISNDNVELLEGEKKVNRDDGDLQESVSRKLDEEDERKNSVQESKLLQDKENLEEGRSSGKEMAIENTEQGTGTVQEISQEKASIQAVKKNRQEQMKNSKKVTKDSKGFSKNSDKHAVVSKTGMTKSREINQSVYNGVKNKQSDEETDMWWLSLPYVLAILMRRGSDHEGPGGLYTLKFTSETQDQSAYSYTVAFEDRGDANNFCYLMESFFEDLVDFSADIVPLSIKELSEAVKSQTMKVIVVKKRQLQLYAGQPFADVEIALRSLVQSARTPNSE